MIYYLFALIFFSLILFMKTTQAFQTVYDSNLISSTCSSSSLLSVWKSGSSNVSCTLKSQCSFELLTDSPLTLTLDLSSLSSYSYLSFDLLVASSSPKVDYEIGSSSLTTLTSLSQSAVEDVCNPIPIYKTSFTALSSTVGSTLVLKISNSSGAQSNKFGLRSLRIYANCAQNCSACSTTTSCSICLNGFLRILASSGDYICEQTVNCQISGCFACIKNALGTTLQCTQCLPGNTLLSGACISLSACNTGQYRDSNGVCQSYSSECIQYDKNGNISSCSSLLTISSYECPINKAIAIYPYQNYEIYTCICQISNCSTCSTSSAVCGSCSIGYYLSGSSCLVCSDSNCHTCTSSTCSVCNANYIMNSTSGFCEPCSSGTYYSSGLCLNCQDPNCQTCTSSVCSVCKANYIMNQTSGVCELCPSGTYYSSGSCFNCLDSNCQTCTSSACSVCKSQYILSGSSCTLCPNEYYYYQGSCLSCSDVNCLTCPNNICTSCKSNYYLNGFSTCVTCQNGYYLSGSSCLVCSDSNCLSCSSTSCIVCKANYSLNQSNGTCVQSNCKSNEYYDSFNQCQTCPDGCDKCTSLSCLICSNSQYFSVDPNNPLSCIRNSENNYFTVKQSLLDSGYLITLNFQNQLKSATGVSQLLVEDSDVFESQSSIAKGKQINITVTIKTSCKKKSAIIYFQNSDYYYSNGISPNNTSLELQNFAKLTTEQQQVSTTLGTVGSAVSTSIVSTFLPIAILSNFYVLVNTIDLTGFLYYLLFINIRFPQNILSFFDLFKNFQFPFIPNIFLFLTNSNYSQQAPQRFMDMGNDAYFLNSAGQSLTIIGGFLIIYFTIKLLSVLPLPIISNYLKGALFRTWEYGSFFDALCSVYIYILTGSYLQFTIYESEDSMYILNYILHSLWSLISFGVPFFILWLLYREKNMKSNEKAKRQLSSLIGGINLYNSTIQPNVVVKHIPSAKQKQLEENKDDEIDKHIVLQCPQSRSSIDATATQASQLLPDSAEFELSRRKLITIKTSHLCNGILYLRKLFFSMIIVYLYNHQYWQLILISLLNIMVCAYIFYVRPYETPSENLKNGTGEIVLIAIQITLATLVEDSEDESEDGRFIQGWIIVGLSAFIILWNTALLLIDSIKSILNLILKILKAILNIILYRFLKHSKIIPLENQRNSPKEDNLQNSKQVEIQIHQANDEKDLLSAPKNVTPPSIMISSNLLYPNQNKDHTPQLDTVTQAHSIHRPSITHSPQLLPANCNTAHNQLELKSTNSEREQSQRNEEEKNQLNYLEDENDKNVNIFQSKRKNSLDEDKKMFDSTNSNLNLMTKSLKMSNPFLLFEDKSSLKLKEKLQKNRKDSLQVQINNFQSIDSK